MMADEIKNISAILASVTDPEVPVLTISDLGIIRDVRINDEEVEVIITPTYSGCPAMDMIAVNIILSPAWTTDWMSEEGKRKLKEYGIAAPDKRFVIAADGVECPLCNSINTKLISEFGSTACKALYQCTDCKEPFDYFKCH